MASDSNDRAAAAQRRGVRSVAAGATMTRAAEKQAVRRTLDSMAILLTRVFGAVLAFGSGLALVISLIGIIDPGSTKMADDNDPFGVRDPWYVPASTALLSTALGAVAIWLMSSSLVT